MGSEALIDFAAMDSAASAVETTLEPVVETPSIGTSVDSTIETAPIDSETIGTETETTNADGSEKSEEEKTAFKTAATKAEADKAIDTKATPENVRKALKTMRDASPSNAAVVKELHGAYERFHAYKTEFPTVQAAKEAKAFIESIGGEEGYTAE